MTVNYEYSRSNKENLSLPIQIKLRKKRNFFCCIFFDFLLSTLNLQCSEKTWNLKANYFWSYSLRKMGLFKCITGLVSENLLEVNVLPRPKNSCRKVLWSNFFIIVIQIELAKAIYNQIWDFRTASWHVDCQIRLIS